MSSFEPEYRSDDEEDDKVRRRGEDEDEEEDEEVHKDGSDEEHEDDEPQDDEEEDVEDDEDEEDEHVADEEESEAMQAAAQQQQQQTRFGMLDDVAEDEEDGGYGYLKKFESHIRHSMVEEYHPELLMENTEDVQARTHIQRDDQGNIVDPYHRTMPLLTKYEKARVLGERAKQLNAGAKPTIEVPETMLDGYLIAMLEFDAKKIPFIIKRPLRNGTCEYWKVSDLESL